MVLTEKKAILLLLMLNWWINAKPPQNLPDIREKMMELLDMCFPNRVNHMITTSDTGGILMEALGDSESPPSVLINKNPESIDNHQPLLSLPTFVFAPRSIKSFDMMLSMVRASPIWKIESLFVIVGDAHEGCKPAAEILKRAQEINTSTSFFLCYEQDNGAMLFMYNRYMNSSQHPWREVETFHGPDETWALYTQEYFEDRENCPSLTFNMKQLQTFHDITTSNTQYTNDGLEAELRSLTDYTPDIDCCNYHVSDSAVACTKSKQHALDPTPDHELCHKHLQLKKRKCCLMSRLVGAGLKEYLHDQRFNIPLQKSRNKGKKGTLSQYFFYEVDDLTFLFVMLAIVLLTFTLAVMTGIYHW